MTSPKALNELGPTHLCTEVYVFYNDKVLMHHRSPHSKAFPGFLLGPGGHIDEGEDVITAAVREVQEETGIAVPATSVQLKAIGIHHHLDRGEVWVNFICRAQLVTRPNPLRHSDEGIASWELLQDLLQRTDIFPPSQFYFDHVLRNRSGIMHAASEWRNSQLVRVTSQIMT